MIHVFLFLDCKILIKFSMRSSIYYECTGNSNSSRAMGKKYEKGRRIWTPKEEEMPIVAMKELVSHGWKAGNGFRARLLCKLEATFGRLMPGTDIKATLHINSKITAWKKDYYALCDVLSKSGVGFNFEGNFTVDCDKSQWDERKVTIDYTKLHVGVHITLWNCVYDYFMQILL